MFFGKGGIILGVENLQPVLYRELDDVSKSYDCIPDDINDIFVSIRAEGAENENLINYDKRNIHLAPEINNKSAYELGGILSHGIKHLNWHPEQNKDTRKFEHKLATFSSIETVEDEAVEAFGQEVETDNIGTVNQIYREALESFKSRYETDFRPPRLVFDEEVSEGEKGIFGEQVGYFIDHENDQIILNNEIVEDLHPSLLQQDLEYMLKRYHDLSLEQKVREDVIPYVESLRSFTELNVQEVLFTELEDSQGAYNPDLEVMKVDSSRLKDFDPVTGQFRSGFGGLPGSVILLHEEVHDRDFAVNPDSHKYLKSLPRLEINDPRNAVLEAPTTFEVMMAGWNVRNEAIDAFKNPLENLSFFRNYPAKGGEEAEEDEIIYPYNLGLFTALSIHNTMMEDRGVDEGTRVTRDILYGNDWDLNQMQNVLEETFGNRDVPNIPRHRRHATEIIQEERYDEEASKIIRMLEEADEDDEMDLAVLGNELVREYRRNEDTFSTAVEDLDDAIEAFAEEL